MIGIIIAVAIYLMSFYTFYRGYKITYSKNGRWSNLKPTNVDMFLTLIPLVNTVGSIMLWLMYPPRGDYDDKWGSKFFNIKK